MWHSRVDGITTIMTERELLTWDEIASRLRVSPRTVQEWARAGLIPVVHISHKVRRLDWLDVVHALKKLNPRKGG